MRILIVGTGPTSLFFYNSIIKRKLKTVQIFVSEFSKFNDYKQSFFGPETFFYREGFRGLGKFWHGVMDVDIVKSLGPIEDSSYFSFFNMVDSNCFEFIPYFVPRFKKLKNILPHVEFIEKLDDEGVLIRHFGGKKIKYDYVFFGTGFSYINDPIVNSGLAKRSGFVSDHLIFNSNELEKGEIDKSSTLNGHFRKYSIEKILDFSIKKSFRPSLSSVIADPKNKAIYSTGKYQIMLNLINSGFIPQIVSSLNLRFGTPGLTSNGYNFFQIKMENIYQVNPNGQIFLNKDVFYSDTFSQLLSNLKVSRDSVLSGIHLHNAYNEVESNPLISWNNGSFKDSRLIILTPNLNSKIDERHFTSYFMRLSEIAASQINL
jgi:hypothetical protein